MNVHSFNTFCLQFEEPEVTFQVNYWGEIKEHFIHPLHKHSFFECCYVTNGSGYYCDNYIQYNLYPGDCFLSKPDVPHLIEGNPEVGIGLIFLAFELKVERSSAEFINRYHDLIKSDLVLVQAETPSTTAAIWQTIQQTEIAGSTNQLLLKHISLSLILSIFQLFQNENKQEKKSTIKLKESMLMTQAKLYIHDNLSLRIKFNELAAYLHVSERQLSRLFKIEMGESFSEYYNKVKIQTATFYLNTTEVTLKKIAELTGFYSIHHFTKTYKDATGFTPGQWRNMKKNQ